MQRRSMTTNGIFSLIAKVTAMMVPLFVYPYVMRVLGAESYGKVTYVESLISYFVLLATLGVDSYAQRECSVIRHNSQMLKKKASQIFVLGIIMSFISLSIYIGLVFLIPDMSSERPLYIVFALMIVSSGLMMNWLYTAQERFDIISIREVVSKVLYLMLCYLLIRKTEDYLLFGIIVVFTASVFPMFWNIAGILKGECDIKPSIRAYQGMKECVAPIFYLALLTIGSKLFTDSDVVMIKWFTDIESDTAVGLYNSAILLPKALDILLMTVAAVITPQLFIAVRNRDENQVITLMNKTSNSLFLISIPSIICCLVFSKEILLVFAGPEYISASPVLQIYSFIILGVLIITLAGTRTYIARQKEKKLFKILVFGAFLNIGLNILFIKMWGIVGAAIATLVAYFVVMIIELTFEHTWHYIFTKDKFKYIIAALPVFVIFLIVKLIPDVPAILTIMLSVSLAGIIYVYVLYNMNESTINLVLDKISEKFRNKI